MGGVAWTEEEDHLLKKCIQQHGEGKWHRVPLLAGLKRCRKSCRLRWLNYLRPNIRRGSFAEEEVELIIKLHKLLGNRWSLIAGRLPGRTANDVKNYWNCQLSKRLAQEAQDKPIVKNSEVNMTQPQNFTGKSVRQSSPDHHQAIPADYYWLPLPPSPPPPPQVESTITSIPILLKHVGEGDGNMKIHQKEEINHPSKEDNGCFVGDFGMEYEFEEVVNNVTCEDMNNRSSKWDWDDWLLDMDLWSKSP